MDTKLLLVKSATLLYRESQIEKNSENSSELVKSVLATIKNPEFLMDTDFGREVITYLKTTVIWMANSPKDTVFDKTDLLVRLRVNIGEDSSLYRAVEDAISPDYDEKETKKQCSKLRAELREYLQKLSVKELIKNSYKQVMFQEETIDWRHFVSDYIEQLEPYRNLDSNIEQHHAIVDSFMLSDRKAMASIIRRGLEETRSGGVIRFGQQALNRMFGAAGGMRRGEFLVIPALQHNFKSGQTLLMMSGAARFNNPAPTDPKKKPLILRVSFENDIKNDVLWLYKDLVEKETGQLCDVTNVDDIEASNYVAERLQATGFEIAMKRIDPTDFTYHDFFELIEKYESDGYEIFMIFCDYLNMMSKKGCTQGPAGTEIRDLFRRMRNFTSRKNISFITPHQLSTEAKLLLRQGGDGFLQEIAGKGYYDSCRTIDQEVDIEIYIHIVKVNGVSYLCYQRGKHRKFDITPDKDLYFVYKFNEVGNIPDDINGRDQSLKKPGAGLFGEDPNEESWFS